ncbi:glutathione S-transferase [Coprinopsis cinerea okayama7|uniref:glutathione transferase n=1 Tax=Coprinopsis cinerea (strain Okayama-7 / 130 / ATCC MYA-4618 / FGSC 9003) TaxID=240176 RepID=A8P396_COPC7|nr:glutathione S-transferase [Coprinopsis cinerea okayama7\|eukprot:XP_001838500.1 glutathione S-transferase [Coprinopsis cinerea okayama7\
MVLKLYAAPLSTASLRVAQVLHEKEVPFEFHPVDLQKKEQKAPEYLEKQPFGQVPYIDDDGFVLYESRAIGRYLALKYANQGTPLVPDINDVKAWSLFEQAASNEYANFESIAVKIVYEKVFKARVGQEPDQALYDAAVSQLSAKLDVYEQILSKQPYLTGDNVTLADLYHIPFGTRLYLAEAGHLIDSRPNVSRWFKSLTARPSWEAVKNGIKSTAP